MLLAKMARNNLEGVAQKILIQVQSNILNSGAWGKSFCWKKDAESNDNYCQQDCLLIANKWW